MNISKYFTLAEIIRSSSAERLKLDNSPTPEHIENLKTVCAELDKVRDQFGAIKVTSGYRSPKVNFAVGGSKTSDHCFGRAIDFVFVDGSDLMPAAHWIANNLQFKQLIIEDWDGKTCKWIHLAVGKENKKDILTMIRKKGKPTYFAGFPV